MKLLLIILITLSSLSSLSMASMDIIPADKGNHAFIAGGIAKVLDSSINAVRRDNYLKSVDKKFEYQLNCKETKELKAINEDKSIVLWSVGGLLVFKEVLDINNTGFSIPDICYGLLGAGVVLFELKF